MYLQICQFSPQLRIKVVKKFDNGIVASVYPTATLRLSYDRMKKRFRSSAKWREHRAWFNKWVWTQMAKKGP